MNQRGRALALAVYLIECCWLYAAIAIAWGLFRRFQDPPFFLGTLALFAAGFGTTWLLAHLDYGERTLRTMAVILGFVAIVAVAVGELNGPVLTEPALVLETIGRGVRWFEGLGREVFAFLAGIVIWLRGSRWGQRRLRFSEVFASFRWGTVIVSLAALSEGLLDWPLRGTLVAIPFFVVGLWALVLAHLSEVYPKAADDRRWHTASMLTIGLIALMGFAFQRPNLLGFWNLSQIGGLLGMLADRLAVVLVYPFAWITQLLTELFRAILGGLIRRPMRFGNLNLIPENLPEQGTGLNIPPWFVFSVKALLVFAAVAVVAWLLFRSLRWLRRGQDDENVDRESVSPESTIGEDLAAWLRRWLGRLPRSSASLIAALPEALSPAALRALYRNLMLLAASRGLPRPDWATPEEYRQRLRDRLPEREVADITAAFVASRYGEHLPSPEAWRALRQGWEHLQEEARRALAVVDRPANPVDPKSPAPDSVGPRRNGPDARRRL